ncbi:MAG: PSD1 and planctomycete cytochrome C domain-containing protein [Pirellulales bacterium]
MNRRWAYKAVVFAVAVIVVGVAHGAEPIDFVRDVRPLFEKRCYECHGPSKQKSGLRLDIKEAAFKGGDAYGPSIVPKKVDESPLIELVSSSTKEERMPPEGEPLSPVEIDVLRRWIAEGAVWPDGVDLAKLEDKRDHWSFKPLAVAPGDHSIDDFISAKLKTNGLTMSHEADPLTWLRRVTFDLTGLPPTLAEVQAFTTQLADAGVKIDSAGRPILEAGSGTSPQVSNTPREAVYAGIVERLLQSERYGERWAQHWLDVVRYADTHGFEVNTERPNAWPYRDYVIRAFNRDTPYDRFIREQIVGDSLGEDAATGFLVTASVLLPGQIGADEPSKRLARQDSLDEIVINIGQTFLGLSVGCARCHDHKFDPITARDYYSFQCFVAGVTYDERELMTPEAKAARQAAEAAKKRKVEIEQQMTRFAPLVKSGDPRPMVNARQNVDRFPPVKTKRVRFTIQSTNNLEPCIDELEVFDMAGNNVALASQGATPTASGSNVAPNTHELRFVNDGAYGNSRSWMSNQMGGGWVAVEFSTEREIDRVVWGRDRQGKYSDRLATTYVIEVTDASGEWQVVADSSDRRKYESGNTPTEMFSVQGLTPTEAAAATELMRELATLDAKIQAGGESFKVFAGGFRPPDEIHLLSRGDPEQPKERVEPAVISALGTLKLENQTPEQERRRALAEWIADPANPLTARVMVNRIWQGHFGKGLVDTPSDFGRSGAKPSHPELLDWLARDFMQGSWGVKRMHRMIVLSKTYRQASTAAIGMDGAVNANYQQASKIDADVRLLWRYPSRRLEAESIRDSMLAVSGKLDLTMYGRGFDLFDKRGGLSGFKPVETLTPLNQRRMIYAHKVRREPEAIFGAFDCPDAGQSTAIRRVSTTPIQALNLFNSRFTLEVATALADRVKTEAGSDVSAQIDHAYRLALNRGANSQEREDVLPVVQTHGLAVLCRALLNSNEFLFIP